jgi:Tol biopolymer transport system component
VLQRACVALTVLAATLLLASCDGGGSGDSAATAVPGGGTGALIYSQPDAIVELDVKTGESHEIIRAEAANSFLLDPAVSRDGSQLAYIVQPPAQIIDNRYDAGTDLWIAARDGSGARLVYAHEQLNALIRYPRWTPDGDIIAIIQEVEETPTITRVAYTVQRIDVATGERTRLLDDAYAIAISPDGSRLAYARPLTEGGESFESIRLDGSSDPVVIVSPENNLLPFNSPQYSPDGTSIAFASADQANAPPTPVLGMSAPASGGFRLSARIAAPLTDGLPQDVWLVDAAGGRPRLLATMQEDLPSLTWAGDGAHVYLLGATGLYEIDVSSGAVTRIGEGVFHGQIAWAPASGG